MEPKIIFEDEELLVLDKPAGMIVDRAETTRNEITIQDWVEKNFRASTPGVEPREKEKYLQIQSTKHEIQNGSTRSPSRAKSRDKSKIQNSNIQNNFEFRDSNFEFRNRAGIVHRLDKETSGLLLVAKTAEAFENLQRQFKERKVKKTYLALVHGNVTPGEGEIRVPVGRLPWDRKKFGVIAGGREAATKYKVLSNYTLDANNYTLLELYPETGRTHQIRVHLKYFGHPIFADSLYAGRKQARKDRKVLSRLFLHASRISFYHPKKGDLVSFESPLPKELKEFLASKI